MKRTSLFAYCAIVSLGLIAPLREASAATVVTAGSDIVDVGDTFLIPVSVQDAVDLISFQFDLAFNPVVVQGVDVTEGPFLASFCSTITPCTVFSPGVIDNTAGLISLVSDSFNDLPPLPNGSGVLANITFTAKAPGISPTDLQNMFLNFSDSGFTAVNGVIVVRGSTSTVPEPGSLATLLMALAALLPGRRRSRTSREQGCGS